MSNDGGPAFPCVESLVKDIDSNGYQANYSSGMSLRDWFAGQILPAIWNGWIEAAKTGGNFDHNKVADDVARRCYELADAMLAEREKK